MYDNASELYSDYREVYFYEYKSLPNANNKYNPINFLLETCNYYVLFENEESSDTTKSGEESADLSDKKEKD